MESSEENLSEPVECPHLHSLQDGGLVCTDCGQTFVSQILVDDAVGLSPQRLQRASNMGNEINGSFMAAKRLLKTNKAYQDRMESEFQSNLRDILHSMGIENEPFKDRILHLFHSYRRQTNIGYGRSGFTALGACVYIAVREKDIPYTLCDVFRYMAHGGEHIEFFSLGKAYKKILTVLELQVHPPKLEALIEKLVDYSGESPSPRIFQRALAVADMAQLSMLHEGRSEASLAVACVVLAIESQTAKKMEAKVLEDLSEERSTTKSQVMKRYKEFRQVLLDYGSSLPFFKDLEKKNFLRILGSLLDFGHEHGWRRGADPAEGEEEEQTLEQKRLPPAFVKSAQNSRITIDRIQRVKERLFKDMHPMLAPNSASGDLAFEPEAILAMDDRDEMIAQYLLDGFSDQEILDFNPVFRRTKKK